MIVDMQCEAYLNNLYIFLLQVIFHFQTKLCDGGEQTIVDDSRKMGKPMELVLGKKFKLEVWETVVRAMAVGEVAKFTVDKSVSRHCFVC